MSERRGTPREENQEQAVGIIAKTLAPQLGTEQGQLVEQEIDERKFATLTPMTQLPIIYFKYRGQVDKIRFWEHFTDDYLVTTQSIDGKRARQVLQAISAAAGMKGIDVAERPNLIARNLWERDWRKKAIERGEVPTA